VEACGQHMDKEAAAELAGRKRHDLVALRTIDPVVLLFEGDALVIACHQTPVGDGDPVRVAGEIAQDFLGSAEWGLAVDVPFAVARFRPLRMWIITGTRAPGHLPRERFSPVTRCGSGVCAAAFEAI
jgi:hypothetical protein